MSSPSAAPQPAAEGANTLPLVGGVVLALVGFFAARATGEALGYGGDVHPLRTVALVAALFVGGVVALRPGRRFVTRVAVLLVAVGLAGAAWAFVPARTDGLSLAGAAARRDVLTERLAAPPGFEDVGKAGEHRREVESLAADYPSLAAGLRADLAAWGKNAARALAEKLGRTPADDPVAARGLALATADLTDAFPDTGGEVDAAVRRWVDGAVGARSGELAALAPGDWAGFDRTAAARRELAELFPAARTRLQDGEDAWAGRAAAGVVGATTKEPPKRRREACREAEARLLALAALGDAPDRFLAARRNLFAAAHEAARAEARDHVGNRKFDLAFTVAVSHGLEWAQTIPHLAADDRQAVADLRETCRYLAKLSEAAGDLPDVAPAPRGKP